MDKVINQINESWSWVIEKPKQVLAINKFGNILVRNESDLIYRICPEELEAEVVAEGKDNYLALIKDEEFIEDWEFKPLLDEAIQTLGELEDKQVFCFKTPAILGGEYSIENIGKISFDELISFSGDLAKQIQDVPDGQQVNINWEKS